MSERTKSAERSLTRIHVVENEGMFVNSQWQGSKVDGRCRRRVALVPSRGGVCRCRGAPVARITCSVDLPRFRLAACPHVIYEQQKAGLCMVGWKSSRLAHRIHPSKLLPRPPSFDSCDCTSTHTILGPLPVGVIRVILRTDKSRPSCYLTIALQRRPNTAQHGSRI